MELLLQQIINGLTVGAVYALIALGYTMVYGILELINFAHGEIYMLGAYLGIILLGFLTATGVTALSLPLSILITIIAAGVICAAYGATMEKIAYRPLREAPRLAPLISAMGMSIFLQNYVMLTQGPNDKVFPHVIPMTKFKFMGVDVTYIQLFIMGASLVMMGALHFFIMKTKMGKAMRATALDKKAAGLMGINIDSVISVTFILGSFLAAVAGVMVGDILRHGELLHRLPGGHEGLHGGGAGRHRERTRRDARRLPAGDTGEPRGRVSVAGI